MDIVGEGFFLTDVELLLRFYYTDNTFGDLKVHFSSRGGLVQRRRIDAEDLAEIMYRSVVDSFIDQRIIPKPKKIKRIEITPQTVTRGKPEFEITLYVRFYTNQEKWSPIEERDGKVMVIYKALPVLE
jgi:hypothetical protein